MKRIAIEEHYFTEGFIKYLRSRKDYPKLETREDANHVKSEYMVRSQYKAVPFPADHIARLTDIGKGRIADIDRDGIDMQVLSLSSPGCEQFGAAEGMAQSKKINEELSQVVEKHPDRFIGLAALAPQSPERAARELERAVIIGAAGDNKTWLSIGMKVSLAKEVSRCLTGGVRAVR